MTLGSSRNRGNRYSRYSSLPYKTQQRDSDKDIIQYNRNELLDLQPWKTQIDQQACKNLRAHNLLRSGRRKRGKRAGNTRSIYRYSEKNARDINEGVHSELLRTLPKAPIIYMITTSSSQSA